MAWRAKFVHCLFFAVWGAAGSRAGTLLPGTLADLSGSRSTGNGLASSVSTASLAWLITASLSGGYDYAFTLTLPSNRTASGGVAVGTASDCTALTDCVSGLTLNGSPVSLTYGIWNSTTFSAVLPGGFYGFRLSGTTGVNVVRFHSSRPPVWEDFAFKSIGTTYGYSLGIDPGQDQTNALDFVAGPGPDPAGIPEPATAGLVLAALCFGALCRRHNH